jgi:DeoR/GlpR family transcriptional regulator of sugar metabolism
MLSAQRKTHLLDVLAREGRVVAKTIAQQLGLSEDSIRRDLRELAEEGRLVRVYGGALPVPVADRPVEQRSTLATDSKRRVAARALELFAPSCTIVLDAGTTAVELARMLPRSKDLTVITPSPVVAITVADHSNARVVMIGGEIARYSMVAGGPIAMEAIHHLAADIFFMGATGIDPHRGLTTANLDDAATKRAIADRCGRTFVFGSEEKIGAVSRYPIIDLQAVSGIITDPLDRNPLIAQLPALTADGVEGRGA